MNQNKWQELVVQLRGTTYQFGVIRPGSAVHHVAFDAGLTAAEFDAAESKFRFRFPPDLREFLETVLPLGPQFPDWRAGDEKALRDWLDLPRQGILLRRAQWVLATRVGPQARLTRRGIRCGHRTDRSSTAVDSYLCASDDARRATSARKPSILRPPDRCHSLWVRLGGLPPPRVQLAGARAVAGTSTDHQVLGP